MHVDEQANFDIADQIIAFKRVDSAPRGREAAFAACPSAR